jgi:hypothetical protein
MDRLVIYLSDIRSVRLIVFDYIERACCITKANEDIPGDKIRRDDLRDEHG